MNNIHGGSMGRTAIVILAVWALAGCASIGAHMGELPKSAGEKASGYGYIPLDGLAVEESFESDSCRPWRQYTSSKSAASTRSDLQGSKAAQDPFRPLLETLPDISVRFAVASFDSSGNMTFGPVKVTAKGGTYRAVLDYVNVDSIPVSFWITAFDKDNKPVALSSIDMEKVSSVDVAMKTDGRGPEYREAELITIPVYVGVGMRLSADVAAFEGGVPLVSLGAIGLEAQAKRLVGTLTVQTIGITGESIATSLPLPSKLDQTTIENGILAIGSARALVYKDGGAASGVVRTARIVGIYSPIGSDPALVNGIISELSRQRPKWPRPCKPV